MHHRLPPKLSLLTDKFFLLGLTTLLLNDLVLKHQFPGMITGKLSDFSGLFVFPFFWSALFRRQSIIIHVLTAIAFVLWKLPVATNFIDFVNQTLGTGFYRVIDYTDLVALPMILLSHKHFNTKSHTAGSIDGLRFITPTLVAIISLFAFVATSFFLPTIKVDMPVNEEYKINVNKRKLFDKLIWPFTRINENTEENMRDSIFNISFDHRHVNFTTKVRIVAVDTGTTRIVLDSVNYYREQRSFFFPGIRRNKMSRLTRKDYVGIFKQRVIDQLEEHRDTPHINFINPRLDTLTRDY